MAIVLMVTTTSATDRLPDAFADHELIVAGSIDEAVTASTRRPPDLILLERSELSGDEKATMSGLLGASSSTDEVSATAHWVYWFARGKRSRHQHSLAACEFLELARVSFDRSGSAN